MPSCGACCFLGDYDESVLADLLVSEVDIVEYLEMVGSDGWCRHFDKPSRGCTQYADRPRFCRVEFDVFHDLYDAQDAADMNRIAIECCEHHIDNIYPDLGDDEGEDQMARFQRIISGETEAAEGV